MPLFGLRPNERIRLESVPQKESFTGSANDNILPRVAIKAYVPRFCSRADVDAPLHVCPLVYPALLKELLSCIHISTKMRARQAEARHMQTYALIATDSRSEYARGKLKRHPLTVCLRMKLSLKY